MEREVIEEISSKDNVVIATGGGAVTDQENVSNLRKNGWVVWLNADTKVIRERMRKEGMEGKLRPPLSGADPLDEIDQILHEREPFYERASDFIVDTDGQPHQEVVQLIMKAFARRDKGLPGEE